MEKSKSSPKGAGKQQRPGSEQTRSSTNIQKGQEEQIQQPRKQGEQLKQKQGPSKGKK
jgi:hypothetical protein